MLLALLLAYVLLPGCWPSCLDVLWHDADEDDDDEKSALGQNKWVKSLPF